MRAKRSHPVLRQNSWIATLHVAFLATGCSLFFLPFIPAAYATFKMVKDPTMQRTHVQGKSVVSAHEPVLLAASQVYYDQKNDVVTATGDVSVTQGETVVLADRLVYDHGNDIVKAKGHVSMLEPSGNVYFADNLEFQDDLKEGVINQFKARLSDNSLFVAARAHKIDDNTTELYKTAYTPCKCDRDGKPKTPMWKIQADRATIDQAAQEVRYHDASFDLYGVPVFYTPYLSHSLPGADNQSGLLMPEFMHSGDLGAVYRQPVYYSIAPDKDVTLTPIYTSLAGPVMAGEYRQMFDAGPLMFSGSLTSAPNRDASGNPTAGHELRGDIAAKGAFRFGDNYDWGFDAHRTTDDTYLRLYNFSNDILLTSKLYVEGFNFIDGGDRTYARMQGLTFQGLTGQDDAKVIPAVAPLTEFTWQSDPGIYNSRVQIDGNAMSLYRQVGDQSRRLSGTAAWKLPYITEDGQVIEFTAQMRDDVYDVSGVQLSNGDIYSGITGREVPEASVMWRYPFIDRFADNSSLTLEPVVQFTVSPGGGNPEKIPNEDSLVPEFTDTNLFDADRYAGLDRIENGPRMSYGMRGQAQLFSDKYVDWLFGQHYRMYNDPTFPFSNDLTSHFSDYVGKVGVNYQPVTVAYRFRLNKDNLSADRSEVDTSFNYYPVMLSGSYLSLKNDPILASKEVVTGSASINLTREWSVNFNGSRDLQLDQTDTAYTGLAYKNECVNVTTMIGKDYTDILDVKPSLTFWFRVSLKNLD